MYGFCVLYVHCISYALDLYIYQSSICTWITIYTSKIVLVALWSSVFAILGSPRTDCFWTMRCWFKCSKYGLPMMLQVTWRKLKKLCRTAAGVWTLSFTWPNFQKLMVQMKMEPFATWGFRNSFLSQVLQDHIINDCIYTIVIYICI